MKLSSFILSALLGSVAHQASNASPIDPSSASLSNQATTLTERALPDWGRNIYNGHTFQSDPAYLGWVIRLSNTYQFRYPSSTWTIPTGIDSAYWLAHTSANVLSTWSHGNSITNHPLSGGWCIDASVSQPQAGWTYAMIPTKLAADWVLGHAANYVDWGNPGPRNAFQNSWLGSNNQALYYFRVDMAIALGDKPDGRTGASELGRLVLRLKRDDGLDDGPAFSSRELFYVLRPHGVSREGGRGIGGLDGNIAITSRLQRGGPECLPQRVQ